MNIFGGDIISQCEKENVHMNVCLILKGYRRISVWMYKYKGIVNGNKERQITYC
jgi:hypothetical protein